MHPVQALFFSNIFSPELVESMGAEKTIQSTLTVKQSMTVLILSFFAVISPHVLKW